MRDIYLRDRIDRIRNWLTRHPRTIFARTWTGQHVLEAVPAAIYLFLRYRDDPRKGLLAAANAGHATAMITAMTGSLLGALHGAGALADSLRPWMAGIERRNELDALADSLVDTAIDLADAVPPPVSPFG